ncbi:endonuclease [Prauserella marina]|uniref:endonuclease/exonuclease/phosphatase family protein n=1 Tax=Prauserella marina TaxID=530584 RepID=UPI000B8D40D2|nr:endonuclease/exonuclease/phosphatase family protein [Prauserella marina]ASR39789.1 endonuclease [Prauserella marina]
MISLLRGAAVVASVAGLVVTAVPAVSAEPSNGPVIAEVYGGGGNSGAVLTTDFVELATAGSTTADLTGLSVQYLPGAPSAASRWQVTPLEGSVEPGGRYLVAEAKGAGGTVALPTPDASGSIAMAAASGTVALVTGAEPLSCRTSVDCAGESRIVDLVGYGSAAVNETRPAPSASNTTSVARDELTDTDDNAADFAAGEPSPTNTLGEQPGGEQPEPVDSRIHEVQGTTRISPLEGETVRVPGVVTATRTFGSSRGFWLQDTEPDDDPRTSEAIFVFTGSTSPSVAPGDALTVTGLVKEYYPDNPATSNYQSLTELTNAQWTMESRENPVPEPLHIGPDTVPEVSTAQPGGNIEELPLRPDEYALDFWEAHESELVSVVDARVVGRSTEYNELYVTTKPEQNPTARGGTAYLGYDRPNTGILKIESLIPFDQRSFPKANTGDTVTGLTSGPLEYDSFGGYTLLANVLGDVKDNGLEREVTRPQRTGELAVATYNVENLSAVDGQEKFDALAGGIVDHLASPDIVTLEEIQDDNGPQGNGDGVVTAEQTLRKFADAIVAAGGPRYQWRQIDPVDLADGGQPGGNIRVGFLFNPNRVSFVDRKGGDATTPVEVVAARGKTKLSVSPGRIDPGNAAWLDSRKPLAGEFVFGGRTVFVVANHFASKGGDQPVHGRYQPPVRGSEVQRIEQAKAVRGFVDDVLAADANANVVVAGDLNDYPFSPTVRTLTEGGALTALISTLPERERYSYVFEGNSQVLDHVLVSKGPLGVDYDVVHINAEFADQASDHDPQVVRFLPASGNRKLDALYLLLDKLERLFGR